MIAAALAAGLGALALAAPGAGLHTQSGATTVFVKLTDSSLTVAPRKVPVGIVVFRIVNNGTSARSFSIPGKRTPSIAAGRSGTLRVKLPARGPYGYASLGRHHAARLTGVLTAFVPCAQPATTTVAIQMDHDRSGITLSQTRIPCGTVTFVVTNIGTMVDSFQVFTDYPHAQGSTPELLPGQTARLTIRFTEKSIAYYQSGVYPPAESEFGGSAADGGSVDIV